LRSFESAVVVAKAVATAVTADVVTAAVAVAAAVTVGERKRLNYALMMSDGRLCFFHNNRNRQVKLS